MSTDSHKKEACRFPYVTSLSHVFIQHLNRKQITFLLGWGGSTNIMKEFVRFTDIYLLGKRLGKTSLGKLSISPSHILLFFLIKIQMSLEKLKGRDRFLSKKGPFSCNYLFFLRRDLEVIHTPWGGTLKLSFSVNFLLFSTFLLISDWYHSKS